MKPKLIPRKYPTLDAASWVDTIYENGKSEVLYPRPDYEHILTIPEEEADRLGYFPDERGHRDDRVKLIGHPSHPKRGTFSGYYLYELSDFGMQDPNYTIFGLTDGNPPQDPQAVVTYNGSIVIPEITVTPKGNYFVDTYNNIKIKPKK